MIDPRLLLPTGPSRKTPDSMEDQISSYRVCTASTTGNLLDCDCGHVTDFMKMHMLSILDEHTLHNIERGLSHE